MDASDERLTSAELQQRLRDGRAGLDQVLATIAIERWEEPLLEGGWSVKDTLSHLTYWQNGVVERLGWPVDRRRAPLDGAATDTINAEVFARCHDEPLDSVLAEFERATAAFAAAYAALDDDALNDGRRWAWTDGDPVWRWAAGDGWEHYAEHADNLRAATAAPPPERRP